MTVPITEREGREPVAPQYLSAKQVAERVGLKPGTLSRYPLPAPDVMIGDVKGWTVDTVDAWNAARRTREVQP